MGGRWRVSNRCIHASCQGHRRGGWNVRRLADRARRAWASTRWLRRVVVMAFAWKTEARAPAARSRLWEMAQRIS